MMHSNTQHDRDPFTFSLRGIRVVNSHAIAPAIAGNGINRAADARLRRPATPCCGQPDATRKVSKARVDRVGVEALLARYFAHGCCNPA